MPRGSLEVIFDSPNQTYLNNYELGTRRPDEDFQSHMFKSDVERDLQIQYFEMNRRHETMQNYQTGSADSEMHYSEQMSGFTLHVFRHFIDHQIHRGLKKAEKNSEEVRTFRVIHEQVGAAAKGAMSFDLDSQLKVGTKTNLPRQKAQVWMESPLVDGSVDVSFGEPWAYDPFSFQSISEQKAHEFYEVSLGRELPMSLNSRVTYGGSTTLLTYAVSRNIVGNLNAEAAAIQGMDSERSGRPEGQVEEKISVNYGLTF